MPNCKECGYTCGYCGHCKCDIIKMEKIRDELYEHLEKIYSQP